jgi:YbgC/YbaW family acyl-CoA thioester hydrolase
MESQYLESFYTVRFNDCDPFRHLNNARYLDYFLNAREDHLRDHYQMDLADFYRKGLGWVVFQHEIIYLKPASFNETICIRSGLLAADTDLLQVEMLMLDQNRQQLKAIMHTRFVPVSLSTGKKEPHSVEFMQFISDKLIPLELQETPVLQERVSHWQKQLSLKKEKV